MEQQLTGALVPRILVIGSRGLLGRALTAELDARGWDWTGVDRQDLDIVDRGALERLRTQSAQEFDWVINVAAYTQVDKAESEIMAATYANALAPGALAFVCADRMWRFLHVSTDYVFDGEKEGPYVETDETNPLGVYGKTKRDGERAVFEHNSQAVVVRTSWLYGPEGRCFPMTIAKVWSEGKALSVVNDQFGTPTYAPDLAKAILDLTQKAPEAGLYHMGGPETMSWFDLAAATLAALGAETPNLTAVPTEAYPTAAKRPRQTALDSSKALSLGVTPLRAPAEALVDYAPLLKAELTLTSG